MRLTPEVLPMLQLRSCQLTLLTSLAFGAVSCAPLTAETTGDLPKTTPNLSGYDRETRFTMEYACGSEQRHGPVAYGECLNQQIASLQRSPGGGTAVHSVNGMSGFTTENIMRVHQGMGSNKILEMFGAPKNVRQSVCGASHGRPWTCTTWEYEEVSYGRASFTFAGNRGSLILNDFDVHKK